MTDGFQRRSVSLPVKLVLAGAAAAAMAYAVRQRRRMDFEGKIVVIAGASRGLGLELARGFAKEGACVVLLARDRSKLAEIAAELESVGVSVAVLGCDITLQDEVRLNIESIIREFKRIDVLINVASIIQVGPSEHMQLEDFAEAMAVHFWGPLYLMKEVILYEMSGPGPYRQHRIHRRQNRGSASVALWSEQICLGWSLRGNANRAG